LVAGISVAASGIALNFCKTKIITNKVGSLC
jgi:hypothetical protein